MYFMCIAEIEKATRKLGCLEVRGIGKRMPRSCVAGICRDLQGWSGFIHLPVSDSSL